MSVCDKIEALLWESLGRTLTCEEAQLLEQHIAECDKCRQAKATFESIGVSKKADRDLASSVDAESFENGVFQKIRARERELRFEHEDKGYMVRLYVSVGLAAAIVAFMVLSLGDLEKYVMPSKPYSYKAGAVEKRRDTLHITLTPEVPEQRPEAPALKIEEPINQSGQKALELIPPPTVVKIPDTVLGGALAGTDKKVEEPLRMAQIPAGEDRDSGLIIAESEPAGDLREGFLQYRGKKMVAPESRSEIRFETGKGQAPAGFSILSKPVTNPSPDSVVINSIYLSDESIPIASQQTRAFLPEVVVDSGIIQSIETPRSVLVTVDKMPVPVKIIPPEYPVWARKNGISGVVWIKARVDKEGDVRSAEVLSSNMPGYGFEEASLEAAEQCKYLPAEAGGYRIEISVIYPVNFIFKEKESQ